MSSCSESETQLSVTNTDSESDSDSHEDSGKSFSNNSNSEVSEAESINSNVNDSPMDITIPVSIEYTDCTESHTDGTQGTNVRSVPLSVSNSVSILKSQGNYPRGDSDQNVNVMDTQESLFSPEYIRGEGRLGIGMGEGAVKVSCRESDGTLISSPTTSQIIPPTMTDRTDKASIKRQGMTWGRVPKR